MAGFRKEEKMEFEKLEGKIRSDRKLIYEWEAFEKNAHGKYGFDAIDEVDRYILMSVFLARKYSGVNPQKFDLIMEDQNKYVGSDFVWEEEKVKEIMQDIVNFTKQSDNNIKWK